jgi:hypothetical protein
LRSPVDVTHASLCVIHADIALVIEHDVALSSKAWNTARPCRFCECRPGRFAVSFAREAAKHLYRAAFLQDGYILPFFLVTGFME